MVREATARITTDTEPGDTRYRSGLAEEVLASEQAVLRLMARNTPLPELLAEVCRYAEALLGEGSSCSILLLDADGCHVKVGAAPSLPEQYRAALDGLAIGPLAGSCGTAMYERRKVMVEDISTDPLWTDFRHLALPVGLLACWSIPFMDEAGAVLGAFAVYHRTPRGPTWEEDAILRDIGRSVGLAVLQNAMAQRLAQTEEHHRLVVDHLNEGVVVISASGVVLACNPSAHRMLRATTTSLVGRNFYRDVVARVYNDDGSVIPEVEWPVPRVLLTGKPLLGQTIGRELADGTMAWINANIVPIIRPGDRETSAVLISFTDVGPAREAQRQLRYLATRDSLTGLHNRAYLADRMQELFEPEGGGKAGLKRAAVLFIDLDGFKKVNDTAGHTVGDALLRTAAHRLAQCVDQEDTLARVGGDEFVIVGSRSAGIADVPRLAQQLLDTIAVPFEVGGCKYYLGASIGISLFPEDGRDAATLMRHADSAMYHAKQRGRHNFQFFTAELNQSLQRRFTIEQSLRRALAAGELYLVYQPIVDSAGGRTVGAEALLRWHSSELGDVPPAEFIPAAEETGMIIPIGEWVLETACAQMAEWHRTIAPDLVIAVNLSPRQIRDGLVEQVGLCLSRVGLEPDALELEITEGLLMNDSEAVLPMLNALTRMGVRIVVDDFGTGYSSLSYLQRFPLHSLKIDRSFVAGLPDRHDSIAITRAVVAMAHSLGMSVTAEGVETPEQAAFLRSAGCEKQQGFLFSHPVESAAYGCSQFEPS